MMANHTKQWGRAAAVAGFGALLVTVGCGGTQNASGVRAQELTAAQQGAPVVVSCEPHQRTLVRQAIVNGAAVSQVECVAADPAQAQALAAQQAFQAAPVTYAAPARQQVVRQAPVQQVIYEDLQPAQIVRTTQPAAARPVQTRQVVYREEPKPETRSVKKSAIIIGSSAGVGAGVGAAVGGKKGALIGAAIGGGGATIWDQATRRK
jgi:hypothetical protein